MQIDRCALCDAPAIVWYPVRIADLFEMTEQQRSLPLCDAHADWLRTGGPAGRRVRDTQAWWLVEE